MNKRKQTAAKTSAAATAAAQTTATSAGAAPKPKRIRIRRRGRLFKIRLLEEERDQVFLASARARVSMHQWIRDRLVAAAKKEGQHPLPED